MGNRERPIALIVCEGKATEPTYFRGLVSQWKLAGVRVISTEGSAPATIVRKAAAAKRDQEAHARQSVVELPYEKVWCVFDVDQHAGLEQALDEADRNEVSVALSNSCFEYWLVLHFERFATTNMSATQMRRHLKKHIKNYQKGKDYCSLLLPRLDEAIRHSEDIWQAQWRIAKPTPLDGLSSNPSTLVHELVKWLNKPDGS